MESEVAANGSTEPREFDAVTLGFAAVGILGLSLEAALFARYKKMVEDFGGSLPGPTQFVLDARLPQVILAVSVALLIGAGAAIRSRRHHRPEGQALLIAAAALTWLTAIFVVWAAYLPLFNFGGCGHIK